MLVGLDSLTLQTAAMMSPPTRRTQSTTESSTKSSLADEEATVRKGSSGGGLISNDDVEKHSETDESEEDDHLDQGPLAPKGGRLNSEQQQRMKREKRLAMNRASARERRRRKRILLEKLEERVLELTKQVQTLQDVNDGLQAHVRKVEGELSSAHAVIASLSANNPKIPPSPTAPTSLSASAAAIHEDKGALQHHLRSLLLAGQTPHAIGAAPGAAALGDVLADRHLALLDLQHQNRRRTFLDGTALAGLATPGPAASAADPASLVAAAAAASSTANAAAGGSLVNPLLGRISYLNALTENTVG